MSFCWPLQIDHVAAEAWWDNVGAGENGGVQKPVDTMALVGSGSHPPGTRGSPPFVSHGPWLLLSDLLTHGRSRWLFRAIFALISVLPTLMLMIVSVGHYREEATRAVMKAKDLQGVLSATIVTEKLRAQFDLGTSFATRPLLVHNVEEGRWTKRR
jgi:hypothetical protein